MELICYEVKYWPNHELPVTKYCSDLEEARAFRDLLPKGCIWQIREVKVISFGGL